MLLYGCDSEQQLTLHLFKHHGVKDPIRRYVNGTRCHICLKEFWVRENLLNHIRRGRTPCKMQAILRGPLLSESEADDIDLELRPFYKDQHRRGLRRHTPLAPCVRVSGPLRQRLLGPVRIMPGALQGSMPAFLAGRPALSVQFNSGVSPS